LPILKIHSIQFGFAARCEIPSSRVPVQTLLAYIEEGDTLDEFLDDFPSVSREHALKVLKKNKPTMGEPERRP
jgi:uncharacterized protein (DUF433 family)